MQTGNYILTFDGLLSIVHSKEYPTTELQEFMIFLYDEIDNWCNGVYGLEKESAMMSHTQAYLLYNWQSADKSSIETYLSA